MASMSYEMAEDFQKILSTLSVEEFKNFIEGTIEAAGATSLVVQKEAVVLDGKPMQKLVMVFK